MPRNRIVAILGRQVQAAYRTNYCTAVFDDSSVVRTSCWLWPI